MACRTLFIGKISARLVLALFIATLGAGCAVNPAEVSSRDPVGIGAAMNRCATKPIDELVLPDWFSIFGPGLACR